ncbi:MAG: DUF7168 domain-containing protein [Methylocella sp.]
MEFTAKPKVEDIARQWLARANLDPDDPRSADAIAQALSLALELATFAPSLSGTTAVDRLVRQRKAANAEERTALGFVRPGKGLANPPRCAAAVYRHVVRHGAPQILDLNHFPEPEDDPSLSESEDGELDSLAHAWAKLSGDAEPPSASVNAARSLTSADHLLAALASSIVARHGGKRLLADAYARLAAIQMETLQRRAAVGIGGDAAPLDRVAVAIERGIAGNWLPFAVGALFDHLKRLLLVTDGAGTRPGDEALARVVQRIRALRAKTVEQGCTEQEALASANKVAELLDRHGLSLSEIELRRQACEGFGIDTGRRRRGVFDACVPSIANFCDCKVWGETTHAGLLRHVFFGLPADVEAARFLYDLIDVAFDTETARFKTGAIYAGSETGERRNAVNSFQTGLSQGIAGKLKAMKTERDALNRTSSGRDLVPLKTSVIDDELAKLGLSFHVKSQGRRKRVLADAYAAGQIAGYQFQVQANIAAANAN